MTTPQAVVTSQPVLPFDWWSFTRSSKCGRTKKVSAGGGQRRTNSQMASARRHSLHCLVGRPAHDKACANEITPPPNQPSNPKLHIARRIGRSTVRQGMGTI